MPPKENAKAKKLREKQEKFALGQLMERQDAEIDEEKGRQWLELCERLDRAEAMLQFHETLVHPSSHLMVMHTAYGDLRSKMQREGALSAERVLAMQIEMRRMEKAGALLQHELVHLRAEVRNLSTGVNAHLGKVNDTVQDRLQGFVASVEAGILRQRDDASECGVYLNQSLEDARSRHVQLARDAQLKAHEITQLWQENTSMHTRIPPRIRGALAVLPKDDLLLILDTLSFEDVALKYLLYRLAPGPDDPFADNVQVM
jgi:hypothetical protein